jgi:hypothetical protein
MPLTNNEKDVLFVKATPTAAKEEYKIMLKLLDTNLLK